MQIFIGLYGKIWVLEHIDSYIVYKYIKNERKGNRMRLNAYVLADYLDIPVRYTRISSSRSAMEIDTIGFYTQRYTEDRSKVILVQKQDLQNAVGIGGIFICPSVEVMESDERGGCDLCG